MITRRIEFDYGHRLVGHESKCRNVHGHRGVALITVDAISGQLDSVGRVIDFSVVKELVGGWVDERWDHGFIFQHGDPIEAFLVAEDQRRYAMMTPPTAENMSAHLWSIATELLAPHKIRVVSVKLYETPNCDAVFAP